MRSPRPWCFSLPTTAVTSRERSCLWMAASHKCKAVTAAPEIAALLKDKGLADEAKKVQKFLLGGPLDAFLQTGRLKTRKCQWPPVSPKQEKEKTMSSAMMRAM